MLGRTFVMALIPLGLMFGLAPHAVDACSGGVTLSVRGLIHFSDYVVQATVSEVDDLGQNVILRIERYLTTDVGPQYVLLRRIDAIPLDYVLAGRSSGGDCLGLMPELRAGDTFYAFLKRDVNGHYRIVQSMFTAGDFTFEDSVATEEVYLEGIADDENFAERGTEQEVTEAEWLEIIAKESQSTPSAPDISQPYPLKAPLLIHTDGSPNQYLLPVDGREPIEVTSDMGDMMHHPLSDLGIDAAGSCAEEGCYQLSPDNLNIAVQKDANTIGLTWGVEVSGQASLFSTTSDTVAVWNDCDLMIFTTGYARLGHDWTESDLLNTVPLVPEGDCHDFARQAVWSRDGRWLAYSDADGLWLWDVYSPETDPILLLAPKENQIPVARYFSPLGRYLAVSEGEEHYTLDIVTRTQFPDGIISPDDRLLLSFATTALPAKLEICSLTPFVCQEILGMYVSRLDTDGETQMYAAPETINKVAWKNDSLFLAMVCVPEDPDFCSIFQWQPAAYGWSMPDLVSWGYDFDYDADNHQLAIVTSETRLTVNGRQIDLTGKIDGNITEVEWMPSLFYHD
jgi:hypothetical protein